MREPDKNRVKRSMEHIMAAITNLNSIKDENRTQEDDLHIEASKGTLARAYRVLRDIIEEEEEL